MCVGRSRLFDEMQHSYTAVRIHTDKPFALGIEADGDHMVFILAEVPFFDLDGISQDIGGYPTAVVRSKWHEAKLPRLIEECHDVALGWDSARMEGIVLRFLNMVETVETMRCIFRKGVSSGGEEGPFSIV